MAMMRQILVLLELLNVVCELSSYLFLYSSAFAARIPNDPTLTINVFPGTYDLLQSVQIFYDPITITLQAVNYSSPSFGHSNTIISCASTGNNSCFLTRDCFKTNHLTL